MGSTILLSQAPKVLFSLIFIYVYVCMWVLTETRRGHWIPGAGVKVTVSYYNECKALSLSLTEEQHTPLPAGSSLQPHKCFI